MEADTTATGQAMGVVLLASVAAGIGSVGLGAGGLGNIVLGAIGSLVGWVIWAFMTYVIGTRLLPEPQTRADMGELMRTLGFAQSPSLARVFVALPVVGPLVLVLVSALDADRDGHRRPPGSGLLEHVASRGRVRDRVGDRDRRSGDPDPQLRSSRRIDAIIHPTIAVAPRAGEAGR